MIGIDPTTGKALTGLEQFTSRFKQVITTPKGTRQKRPEFGSAIPSYLGINLSDETLLLIQSESMNIFYNPANGLTDFAPSFCQATRHDSVVLVKLKGKWKNKTVTIEVPLSA